MTSLGGSGQDEHPDESHAHAKAAHLVGRVADSMKLEAQGVADEATERQVSELAASLLRDRGRDFWDV